MAESDLVELLRRLFTADSAYVFRFLQGKYSVELFHEGAKLPKTSAARGAHRQD
jgi:hypothetical protein